MAKSGLEKWIHEDAELLETIVKESRTDKEIFETMAIDKSTFYAYMKNADFFNVIKKAKDERQKTNSERLKKLHDAMWEKACGYVSKETVRMVGDGAAKVQTVEREYSHDPTLMIYLDKTYGQNINSDEIRARADVNRARAEEAKLAASDSETLEKAKEILGGIQSVIK